MRHFYFGFTRGVRQMDGFLGLAGGCGDNRFHLKRSGRAAVHASPSPNRGFTLIEATVVVAIAGILSTMALANIGPIVSDVRLNGSARGLAALVQTARARAINEHSRVRINTATTDRIFLESCSAKFGSTGCIGASTFVAVPGATMILNGQDAVAVTLAAQPASALIFGPDGLPEGSPTVRTYQLAVQGRPLRRSVDVTVGGEARVR